MRTQLQRQLISDVLNNRGNATEALQLLGRSLFHDSRLLQVFLAVRASLRELGTIDKLDVVKRLTADARSKDEAFDLALLIDELVAIPQQNDVTI